MPGHPTENLADAGERAPRTAGTPRSAAKRASRVVALAVLAAGWLVALRPAAAQQDVAGAPEGRPIIVGGDQSYPPYEFIGRDGRPAGFNVDLTRALARVTGLRLEVQLGPWAEMRHDFEEGRIGALQGMTYTEERARRFRFTPPHTIVQHAIFARRGAPPVTSLSDLAGREVAVLRNGVWQEVLQRQHPGVRVAPQTTHADVLQALADGRHDYAVMARLPGLYLLREMKIGTVAPLVGTVSAERYCYVVAPANAELAARIAEGLAMLKGTGEYDAIHERWLGVLEPSGLTWREVLRYGAAAGVPLTLLLVGVLAWSRTLKREVDARTEELRRNQQALVQAGKLAALGELVSGVAHEVNNPNGLILMNLPVLADCFADARAVLDERAREHGEFKVGGLRYSRMREEVPRMLTEMLEASRRVKRIVEDLKDFARQQPPELTDGVDLNEVVRAGLRLADALVRRSTAHLSVELASGLPPLRANPQRVEQVVVNLVVNACQALPDRERGLMVRTRLDAGRRAVCLEVIDQGVGIPPENLARLTEPFFTTRRAEGGTGLGLSVSAGIASEHGGALEFESTPGQGTTARLVLPLPAGSTP